jgi:hypothetical protein
VDAGFLHWGLDRERPGSHLAGMLGGVLIGGFISNQTGAALDEEDRRPQPYYY